MARWAPALWASHGRSGIPRRDRRSGEYRTYLPDPLQGARVVLDQPTDVPVTDAERRVLSLSHAGRDLTGVARFLLRSQAIASSRIEGIAPPARQVALAELGQSEDVTGISEHAQLVANNMTVVRDATTTTSSTPSPGQSADSPAGGVHSLRRSRVATLPKLVPVEQLSVTRRCTALEVSTAGSTMAN